MAIGPLVVAAVMAFDAFNKFQAQRNAQELSQCATFDELGRHPRDSIFGLTEVEHTNDVGVREGFDEVDLSLKAAEDSRAMFDDLGAHHLERDVAPNSTVVGLVDNRKPTHRQGVENRVPTDLASAFEAVPALPGFPFSVRPDRHVGSPDNCLQRRVFYLVSHTNIQTIFCSGGKKSDFLMSPSNRRECWGNKEDVIDESERTELLSRSTMFFNG